MTQGPDSEPGSTGDSAPPPAVERVPLLSFAFVVLALAALTVIPILTSGRIQRLQSTEATTIEPGDAVVRELQSVFGEEVIALGAYRLSRDTSALHRYERLRDRQAVLVDELGAVARSRGAAGARFEGTLRDLHARWQAVPEPWLAGDVDDTELIMRVNAALPVRDSLVEMLRVAEDSIASGRAAIDVEELGVVANQRRLSVALGALALVASIIVARAALRERRLRARLERAAEEEQRARRLADQRAADLAALSESKARLTRGFSHDVKNPLGAADGYLALLEDGIPEPVTSGQQATIGKARRSVAAALNLIEDLLEIERASTGHIRLERAPTDLSDVVTEAVDAYRAQAEAKGLELDVDLAAAAPLVHTDRMRVRQVLGNLISNAVKYTAAGSVSVRMRRRRPPEKPGTDEHVAIEVSDTGVGIPPEKRHLLFQEFARFEPGMARGTGIGLAISHRLVQALGGDLLLEETSAGGSRFTLFLPVDAGAQSGDGAVVQAGDRVSG